MTLQKRLFYFLRVLGVILLFFVWFFLGMNRMELAHIISKTLPNLPFISVLDTGLVSILFIILNGFIILLYFFSVVIFRKTIIIHLLAYTIVVIMTLIYKFFETQFLLNLSENLLRFYFSPLIPLLLIIFFHISTKLKS
jgi:hypothetical protein